MKITLLQYYNSNSFKGSKVPVNKVLPVSLAVIGSEAVKQNDTVPNGDNSKNEFIATQKIKKLYENKPSHSRVYILSGSSGVGKDTILKAFLERNPNYNLSVSYTTRPIREGEINGKDYFFVTKEEFQKSIDNDEFLDWEDFSGNKYGTKKESVEKMIKNNENIILKLDTKGALKVKKLIPDAVLIFVMPPSIKELESRLRGRKTEDEEAIQKRMAEIKSEIDNSKQFDYIITNDTVENAVSKMEEILKS